MSTPVVFFTRDLSAKGLKKIYSRVSGAQQANGKVMADSRTCVPWVNELIEADFSGNTDCESMLVLSMFKGDSRCGFTGANANIGNMVSDGLQGSGSADENSETFIEGMTQSTKSFIEGREGRLSFINVMCKTSGDASVPDVGIVASLDILAVDAASVDLTYAMKESNNRDMVECIESNSGIHQLTYMGELGMGSDMYVLIDIDNGDAMIFPEEAVATLYD